MSTQNINYTNLDSRYSKPTDVAAAISAQAATDAGQYTPKSSLFVNVKDYGAKGDGTDDTTAILAAITAAMAGTRKRTVYFPAPTTQYLITAPIPLQSGLHLVGANLSENEFNNHVVLKNGTTDMFSLSSDVNDVHISGIGFYGNSASPVGNCFPTVNSATGYQIRYSVIERCSFQWFIYVFQSRILGTQILDNYFDNCTGTPLWVYGSDNNIVRNYLGSTALSGNPTGAWIVRLDTLAKTRFSDNFITGQPAMCLSVSGCRDIIIENNNMDAADAGQTDGAATYLVNSVACVYRGNAHYRSLGNPFSLYTGVITCYDSSDMLFDGNIIDTPVLTPVTYAAFKIGQSATTADNVVIKNTVYRNCGNLSHIITAGTVTNLQSDEDRGVVAPTYGTTVTPSMTNGQYHRITVTNSNAFTVANPSYYRNGQIVIEIYNNSGGAMGAITWGTAYQLVRSFTNPASGQHRSITFRYDGVNMMEVTRSGNDDLAANPATLVHTGDNLKSYIATSNWKIPEGTTSTSATIGLGNIRLFPLPLPYNGGSGYSITAFQIDITSASDASGVFRFGVYADSGGYPGALILDAGTITTSATGLPVLTLGTAQAVSDASLIWIGGVLQGYSTAPTLRILSNPPWSLPSTVTPIAGEARWGYATSAAYTGSLPSTFPASQAGTGTIPRVSLKF